jgi:hypothetical protein
MPGADERRAYACDMPAYVIVETRVVAVEGL